MLCVVYWASCACGFTNDVGVVSCVCGDGCGFTLLMPVVGYWRVGWWFTLPDCSVVVYF